jgi:fatty acid synthase subunit alpha
MSLASHRYTRMASRLFREMCAASCLSVTSPTAPHAEINEKDEMSYSEGNRENMCKLKAFVEEMASADLIFGLVNIQKIQDDVVKTQPEISEEQK